MTEPKHTGRDPLHMAAILDKLDAFVAVELDIHQLVQSTVPYCSCCLAYWPCEIAELVQEVETILAGGD